MNSKELMKKLEVGRVGYGTQTYNDVALTLNKEETLELLNHIEQIEKENQELKEINEQLEGCNKEVSEFAYQIEMEREVLKEKVDELEQVIEKIKKLPHCDICDANWHKGCLCLQKKIKEVLENDR